MSLRGSETTEAISQGIDISEIATLPRITCGVARNDREGIGAQPPEARGWGSGIFIVRAGTKPVPGKILWKPLPGLTESEFGTIHGFAI